MSRVVPFATGSFNGATAAILSQSGAFTGLARNGAGDYTFTLEPLYQIAPSDQIHCEAVQTPGAASVASAVEYLTSSTFRVRLTRDVGAGGVATDTPFSLSIQRVQKG